MDKLQEWNKKVEHPLQAYEWGEFREKTGIRIVREGGLQVTIHSIPHTPWNVGYAPKIIAPIDHTTIKTLKKIATENKCIFIKLEPKVEILNHKFPARNASHSDVGGSNSQMKELGLVAGRPLFTKYNFVLDVSKSEAELLAQMKQKTRYNIKVAEKRGVKVELDDSPAAFERYLALTKETTDRQGFYAHGPRYHRLMWSVLGNKQSSIANNQLSAHLLVAKYEGQIITTWVLFKFKDTLYYPYGASTREHREVMANNLVMWEAIKLAKKWNCKYLDMWGALGPEPDPKDPWLGFHNFKLGYGPRHVEYVGTWDYVERPILYRIYRLVESARWFVLRTLRNR